MREHSRRTRDAELRFTAWHCGVWKPVIAAVNGTCAGGGLHFVADADIVIAASDATFVDPHVSLGQVVAYEGIALARKSPMEAVLRMALVGRSERLSSARALQLGIVSQVVDPPERLRDEAQELAEKIARNSPAAMAATKRALWGALEAGLTDACRPARRSSSPCGATPTRKRDHAPSPRSAKPNGRSERARDRPCDTTTCSSSGTDPSAGSSTTAPTRSTR